MTNRRYFLAWGRDLRTVPTNQTILVCWCRNEKLIDLKVVPLPLRKYTQFMLIWHRSILPISFMVAILAVGNNSLPVKQSRIIWMEQPWRIWNGIHMIYNAWLVKYVCSYKTLSSNRLNKVAPVWLWKGSISWHWPDILKHLVRVEAWFGPEGRMQNCRRGINHDYVRIMDMLSEKKQHRVYPWNMHSVLFCFV